jgi:hypothetical protein
MLVCVRNLGATGGHADRNGPRHDLAGKEADETGGIADGPDRLRAAVRHPPTSARVGSTPVTQQVRTAAVPP